MAAGAATGAGKGSGAVDAADSGAGEAAGAGSGPGAGVALSLVDPLVSFTDEAVVVVSELGLADAALFPSPLPFSDVVARLSSMAVCGWRAGDQELSRGAPVVAQDVVLCSVLCCVGRGDGRAMQ